MTGAVVLGRWWRGAAALSAALAVAAHLTENRTLAFERVGICVALLIYAAARSAIPKLTDVEDNTTQQ
jgi:hypothetical protein